MTPSVPGDLPVLALELIAGDIPDADTRGMRQLGDVKAAAAKICDSCAAELKVRLDTLPDRADGEVGQVLAGQLKDRIGEFANSGKQLGSSSKQLHGGADDFDLMSTQIYIIGITFAAQAMVDLMMAGGVFKAAVARIRAKIAVRTALETGVMRMEARALAEGAVRATLPSPRKLLVVGAGMGAGFGAATPLAAQWWEKEVKHHGADKPYNWSSVAEGAYSGAVGGAFGALAASAAAPAVGRFVNRVAARAKGRAVPRVLGTVSTMAVGGVAGVVGGATGMAALWALPGTELTGRDWRQALISGFGGGFFGAGGAAMGGLFPHPGGQRPLPSVEPNVVVAEDQPAYAPPHVGAAATEDAPASNVPSRHFDDWDFGLEEVAAGEVAPPPDAVLRTAEVLMRHVDAAGVERFLVVKAPTGDGRTLWRPPTTALDPAELPLPNAARGLRERLGVPSDYAGTLREVDTRIVQRRDGEPVTRIVVEASERFETVIDASAMGVYPENAAWMTSGDLRVRHDNQKVHPEHAATLYHASDAFDPVPAPADNAERLARVGSRLGMESDAVERLAQNVSQRPPDEQRRVVEYLSSLNRQAEMSAYMVEVYSDRAADDLDAGLHEARYDESRNTAAKQRALAAHPDLPDALRTPMAEDMLAEFARSSIYSPDDVGDVLAFVGRPETAAALRTIEQRNPEMAEVALHRMASAQTAELPAFGRELQKVAQLPAGTVDSRLLTGFARIVDHTLVTGDFSPAGMAARDRARTAPAARAWDFLLTLDDYSPAAVRHAFAAKFLEAGQLANLPDHVAANVSFSAAELKAVEDLHLAGPHSKDFSRYVEEVGKLPASQQPLSIRVAAQLVGEVRPEFATCVRDLLVEGHPERSIIGLRQTGEGAISELKAIAGSFKTEVRSGDISPESLAKVQSSDFVAHLLIDVTNYATSGFGPHGMDSLRTVLAYHTQAELDGRIVPMHPEYQPSDVFEIPKLRSHDDEAGPQWTEDLLERYRKLAVDLEDARTVLTTVDRPFTHLLERVGRSLADHVQTLERSLESGVLSDGTPMNDRARTNIAARVAEFKTLIEPPEGSGPQFPSLRSLKDFERNFLDLARIGDLHSDLRTICFAWAMRKHPEWVDQLSTIRPDTPTLDDVSKVREFVDHITNQEVFADYFANRRSANTFQRLTSTRALEEAILRTQGVGVSSDTIPLQFVPTRGPLLELSGHIASACWAGKYSSVAEEMPNMTGVMMVRHPEDPARTALVGAGLLIETTNPAGDKILLIRGLNPLENYINHVSIDDFYQQFTGWAKGIAEARGAKLAIVIDGHSGGAATNRPALFGYLKTLKLTPVRVNGADTEFNRYNVTQDAYLVP
ncbi:MAG: hypothetical protein HOQ24_17770 [Mycobacteriaceae bacterium]|nr:hypothetical protein [Mycobacteriaceae bacterium]